MSEIGSSRTSGRDTRHAEYGPCDTLGVEGRCSECTGHVRRANGLAVVALGDTFGGRQMQANMPDDALLKWLNTELIRARSTSSSAGPEMSEREALGLILKFEGTIDDRWFRSGIVDRAQLMSAYRSARDALLKALLRSSPDTPTTQES